MLQVRTCKHANSLLAWFPVIVLLLQKQKWFPNFNVPSAAGTRTPDQIAKHPYSRLIDWSRAFWYRRYVVAISFVFWSLSNSRRPLTVLPHSLLSICSLQHHTTLPPGLCPLAKVEYRHVITLIMPIHRRSSRHGHPQLCLSEVLSLSVVNSHHQRTGANFPSEWIQPWLVIQTSMAQTPKLCSWKARSRLDWGWKHYINIREQPLQEFPQTAASKQKHKQSLSKLF